MNRLLYVLLIAVITITGFSMYQHHDIGHLSFRFADIAFETNLIVFIAALLCVLFVALVFVKIVIAIKAGFEYFGSKRQLRLKNKARLSLSQGLIDYAEGRFQQSEKTLMQMIKYNDDQLPVYLTAARAAQQLGAHDRRDEYLRQAHQIMPEADVAISLTQAELQLAHEQNEQALATLTQLYEKQPDHTYVLTLLVNTYKHLQDWDNLAGVLPQMKKRGVLSDESFQKFEIDVCKGQLSNRAKSSQVKTLLDYWDQVAQHLKTLPSIVEHYARQLIAIDASGEAEKVLRVFLDKHWHESTIVLYSELDVLVDNKQLEMVESWLKDHQNNAYLLLALGKMCISRSLWGKARSYLEASISIEPMPENYLKLARLLEEHINDTAAAQEYYRQGLHLLTGECGDELLSKYILHQQEDSPKLTIVKS